MNFYECSFILEPNLGDEEVAGATEKIRDIILNSGGEVLKSENWGRKKLAYEIKKQKKGLYIILVFKSPASTIQEIEKLYKIFDPILKFMVIKLGKKEIQAALPKEGATNPDISEREKRNV
ncbi:MAG: 30S ribosomal protein S6 [Nitrospirae bacterium]|nr:30S ribosomal protein S6 [Nitrospirota bacterium]